jgi:hypothetical protein
LTVIAWRHAEARRMSGLLATALASLTVREERWAGHPDFARTTGTLAKNGIRRLLGRGTATLVADAVFQEVRVLIVDTVYALIRAAALHGPATMAKVSYISVGHVELAMKDAGIRVFGAAAPMAARGRVSGRSEGGRFASTEPAPRPVAKRARKAAPAVS